MPDVKTFLKSGELVYDTFSGRVELKREGGYTPICEMKSRSVYQIEQVMKLRAEGRKPTEEESLRFYEESGGWLESLGKFIIEAVQEKLKREARTIRFAESAEGDWEGLYMDGKLVDEGHSIPVSDVLDHLDIMVLEPVELSDEEMEHFGYSCPKTLQELFEFRKKDE